MAIKFTESTTKTDWSLCDRHLGAIGLQRLPFGKPILRSANRTRLASPALNEICLQITRIEGDADDTYDRGLELLYQKAKGGDARDIVI